MSSVKALKKLKKKTEKAKSYSLLQLQALGDSQNNNRVLHRNKDLDTRNELKKELNNLSGQVAREVASELAAPLNPLLSWFGLSSDSFKQGSTPLIHSVSSGPLSTNSPGNDSARLSLAAVPLKSPPCKKCPALTGSLCKCAVKRFS